MSGFISELKRRNVIRMAGLYLVGAWLIVQVAGSLLPVFGAPGWVMKTLVGLLAVAFVPALLFAWVFEMTPDGVKRDEEVPPGQSIAPQTAQRMNRMIIAVLLLALTYFGFDKFVLAPRREAPASAMAQPQVAAPVVAASVASDKSIAVLPFVNMSSDQEQEYFSDGLSEELLNQLAQIPQLRVIARTSSFSFKGKEVDVATIAKALNVANVLEGSVRKSGNTLRITAQLIRASDSSHLWSQTYDRNLTDVFKVQDEISREVVTALKLELLPGKLPDSTQRTHSPAAYEQYLIAQGVFRAGVKGAPVETALSALQRAIAIDPDYANAYALQSMALGRAADFAEDAAARERLISAALASADKAIALAPDLAIGYVRRGSIRFAVRWDWMGAKTDIERAIALEPDNAIVLSTYAQSLLTLGQREQALQLLRRAVVSDPLAVNAWTSLGRGLEAVGQTAEAKRSYERALEISPKMPWGTHLLGSLLLRTGHADEALAVFQSVDADAGPDGGIAMAEYTRGNEVASRNALASLEKHATPGMAFQMAEVRAWRGEKDQAFAWLDQAYAAHDGGLVRLPWDPAMDPLRDDPRFAALIKKMGFPK